MTMTQKKWQISLNNTNKQVLKEKYKTEPKINLEKEIAILNDAVAEFLTVDIQSLQKMDVYIFKII